MIIKNAFFIKSAASQEGFMNFDKPIICVSGRSNVGKSSFINKLANQKKLAKTSNTPGRTRLVNYFDFGEFIVADLPGYGYAEVSKGEKEKWSKTLDDFFKLTKITHCLALVDIRHEPSNDDKLMVSYLYQTQLPFTVIATKSDKIPKTKKIQYMKVVANALKLGIDNIISTSAETGDGKEAVLELLDRIVGNYYQNTNENEDSEELLDNADNTDEN